MAISAPCRLPAKPPVNLEAQRGFSYITLAVFLVVFSGMLLTFQKMMLNSATAQSGQSQGALLNQVAVAVSMYKAQNLATLTGAAPAVAGFANPMNPRVAELKAQGYLNANVQNAWPDGNTYNIVIARTAGCFVPGQVCSVQSVINMTNPILDANNLPNLVKLGALGGQVSFPTSWSLPPNPGNITGGNGGWAIPNPDPANRVGIVVVVDGLGGAGNQYLSVGDPRDPNFQGNENVQGQITSMTGVSTNVGGCQRVALTPGNAANGGKVTVTDVNCNAQATIDGTNGNIQGNTIQNNTQTGGIRNDGRNFTPGTIFTATANLGAACANAGETTLASAGAALLMATCKNSAWVPATGVVLAAAGGVCTSQDAPGMTTSGQSLICNQGFWATHSTNVTLTQASLNNVPGGTAFSVKNCPAGQTPWASYSGQTEITNSTSTPGYEGVLYSVSQIGSNWITLTQAINPPGTVVTVNQDSTVLGTIPVGVFTAGCTF